MNGNIQVSIIIPVRNRTEKLAKCLNALVTQTYPSENYEVIVVDNDSTEDIAGVCRTFAGVQCVFEAKPGSYVARNTGIANAKGAIIAFTDSDCVPDRAWLENGVQALKDLGSELIGGKIEYMSKAENLNMYETFEQLMFRLDNQEAFCRKNYAATANIFVYRRAIEVAGNFDERIKSLGDVEWGQRLFNHGFQVKYSDKAVVYHPRRSTHQEIIMKIRRGAAGRQQKKIREKRYMSVFSDFVLESPLSPKIMLFALLCPGIGGLINRLRFACAVFQYSAVATVERIRISLGLPAFRGD